MNPSRGASYVCWTLCLALCLFLVFNVTKQYLDYNTVTQAEVYYESRVEFPVLTFCFLLSQIEKLQNLTTAADVFKVTPSTSNVITMKLQQHDAPLEVYETKTPSDVIRFVDISKSIKMGSICYSIRVKDEYNRFDYGYAVGNTQYPRLLMVYVQKIIFPKGNFMSLSLSSEREDFFGPTVSLEVNRKLTRPKDPGWGERNYMAFTYMSIATQRLPPPYTTECLNYASIRYRSRKHCLDSCLTNRSIELSNRIPSCVKIPQKTFQASMTPIGKVDESVEELCDSICHRHDCNEKVFVLKLVSCSSSDQAKLDMYASDSPTVVLKHLPAMSLADFIILLSSCFVFWVAHCPLTVLLRNNLIKNALGINILSASKNHNQSHANCYIRIEHLKAAVRVMITQSSSSIGPTWCLLLRPICSRSNYKQLLSHRVKIYTFFCWILSLAGCISQVYVITNEYMRYDTITQITIVNEEVFSVPVASFCFPLYAIEGKNPFEAASDIFAASPSIEKLGKFARIRVDSHPYYHYAENATEALKVINIERSVKKFSLCYSLKVQPEYNFFNFKNIVGDRENNTIYDYAVSQEILQKAYVYVLYISSEIDDFLHASEASLEVNRDLVKGGNGSGHNNHHQFTYMIYRSHRLPPPYTTQCLDYTDIGFRSQKHCRHECLQSEAETRVLSLPTTVKVTEGNLQEDVAITSVDVNEVHPVIENICRLKCWRPNCKEDVIVAKSLSKTLLPYVLLSMVAPDSPMVHSIYVPRRNFAEFSVLLLSCFAFWLGISVLGSMTRYLLNGFKNSVHGNENVVMYNSSEHIECARNISRLEQLLDCLQRLGETLPKNDQEETEL